MTPILPQARKLAMLTTLVTLAACTQVQESLQSANEKIHDLVGSTTSTENSEADTPARKSSTPVSTAADADVALAVRLMEGDGVPRNPARAVELVRPHAEAGHAEAQFLLGLAYGNGQGVDKDRATAISWYRRAAAQDQAHAQFLLGMASLSGDGADKDPNKATEWFGKSARNGNAGAQYRLALAYERGSGIEKDEAAATQWYERAAEQGHAEAQFKTGAAYQVGRGVPKNRAWATRWFAKAALQGVASSQYMTGLAYAAGSGVPKDNAVAYRWFSVAAERGFDKAEPFRDRVGERLSEDRRAKEHAAAQNWKPVGAEHVTGVDDSPSIAFAQHTLASLGFKPGVADGLFGPQTSGAVKAYETAKGLPVSGTITRELLIKLKDDPIHAS